MQFWHSCNKKFDENRYIFLQCPIKMVEIIKFSLKKVFPKNFQWTCRRQFWLLRSKIFWHRAQKCRSGSEGGNLKNNFISKRIFRLKLLPWTVTMHFWHSCHKNYDKSQFFAVQSKTMIQKVKNLCKNLILFKNFLWRCRV